MGYPTSEGYRDGQRSGDAGLSDAIGAFALGGFLNEANKIYDPLGQSLLKRLARDKRLAALLRANPYLGLARTAFQLVDTYYGKRVPAAGPNWQCGGPIGDGPFQGGGLCGNRQSLTAVKPGYSIGLNGRRFDGWWGTPTGITIQPYLVSGWYAVTLPVGYAGAAMLPFATVPRVRPNPWAQPWFDPWALPIAQPVPETRPAPWRVSPYRPPSPADPSPVPHPDPGTGVPPVEVPGPVTDPVPGPDVDDPAPSENPNPGGEVSPGVPPVVPPFVFSPTPGGWMAAVTSTGGSGNVVRHFDTPFRQPPGRRVTEVKIKSKAAASVVWLLANGVTETKDFIEALWKALPKRLRTYDRKGREVNAKSPFRSHAPPFPKMSKELVSGLKKIDWMGDEGRQFVSNAVANVAANQLQDYVFGKTGQAVARQSAKSGRPIGYAAGPAL